MGGAAVVIAGYAADRILGDPARLHPVAGFGAVAGALEARLWRPRRTAGIAHTALLVGAAWAATAVGRRLAGRTAPLVDAAVLWATLGGRSLERAASELAAAVESGDLERARVLAPALVGRDPRALGSEELCRAAVESVAENTSDAVLAPLLWFAVGGARGCPVARRTS